MKKPNISIFITLACILAAGVFGYALGRNTHSEPAQLVLAENVTASTTETLSPAPSGNLSEPLPRETDAVSGEKHASGLININTASHAELTKLPGIGEVLAQRIIDYRDANGPFRTKADLTKVSGIGKKKLEAVIDLITVEDVP